MVNKLRPQVLLIIVVLAIIATYSMYEGNTEIAAGIVGGLIGMSKNLLDTDK